MAAGSGWRRSVSRRCGASVLAVEDAAQHLLLVRVERQRAEHRLEHRVVGLKREDLDWA